MEEENSERKIADGQHARHALQRREWQLRKEVSELRRRT